MNVGAIRDALQGVDREHGLGEVAEQQLVGAQLHLDRDQQLLGLSLGGGNQQHEAVMAVEHGPQRGDDREGRLAAAARHGQHEAAAVQDGELHLLGHAVVVF
jgi:hypothetical protein